MPIESGHVFIFHTSADDGFVKALCIKQELHGISLWVDARNLQGGKKLAPKIEQAILDSSYVIAVLSPRTIQKHWLNY